MEEGEVLRKEVAGCTCPRPNGVATDDLHNCFVLQWGNLRFGTSAGYLMLHWAKFAPRSQASD